MTTKKTNAVSACGIDLGTATRQNAKVSGAGQAMVVPFPDGNTWSSSTFYFQDGEHPIMGQEAENLSLIDPENSVSHWKRSMGTDEVLYTTKSGKKYRAKDFAALAIADCKKAIEDVTSEIFEAAVIGVPANASDIQKSQTIEAGEKAGFSHVELAHEPTAALWSYIGNSEREMSDGIYLVVDIGGGTTDITLCERLGGRSQVKSTNGISQLGGVDFSQELFDHCVKMFRNAGGDLQNDPDAKADLWRRCNEGKIRLNRNEKITIPIISGGIKHQVVITKDEACDIWKSFVDQVLNSIIKTLEDANVDIGDVNELIPIGGGSQNFHVLESLARFFGRPLSTHVDPHHAVAKGCVLQALESLGEVATEGIILPARGNILKDITAHALGVKALDAENKERFTPVLKKGVPMPSYFSKTFQLVNVEEAASNSSISAQVEIYQGEPDKAISECTQLGKFELEGLPNISGRPHRIDIEMRIDKNGLLTATATCTESEKQAEMQVTYKKSGQAA